MLWTTGNKKDFRLKNDEIHFQRGDLAQRSEDGPHSGLATKPPEK